MRAEQLCREFYKNVYYFNNVFFLFFFLAYEKINKSLFIFSRKILFICFKFVLTSMPYNYMRDSVNGYVNN